MAAILGTDIPFGPSLAEEQARLRFMMAAFFETPQIWTVS